MSRMKLLAAVILAVAMLAFGAVTVSAVSDAKAKGSPEVPVITEAQEEEMAVGAFYADLALTA